MFVNPLGYWTGLLAAGKCKHGAKITSSGYWTGLLAAKQCQVNENLQKIYGTSFKVLYSNIELLDRIKTSEWVKWQPCRGYGRLLAAVDLSTVLEILSLILWLTGLKIVISFHLLKHCWKKMINDDVWTTFWLLFLSWNFLGCLNLNLLLLQR